MTNGTLQVCAGQVGQDVPASGPNGVHQSPSDGVGWVSWDYEDGGEQGWCELHSWFKGVVQIPLVCLPCM